MAAATVVLVFALEFAMAAETAVVMLSQPWLFPLLSSPSFRLLWL